MQNIGFFSIPESIFSGIQNLNSGINSGIEILLINAPYIPFFAKKKTIALLNVLNLGQFLDVISLGLKGDMPAMPIRNTAVLVVVVIRY